TRAARVASALRGGGDQVVLPLFAPPIGQRYGAAALAVENIGFGPDLGIAGDPGCVMTGRVGGSVIVASSGVVIADQRDCARILLAVAVALDPDEAVARWSGSVRTCDQRTVAIRVAPPAM